MARNSLVNIMNLVEEAKQSQPVESRFLTDLERSIEIDAVKNRRPGSRTYKPSGMNCIRRSYYVITGVEGDPADASYVLEGICNSGSDIHVRIQTAVMNMTKNGMDCEWVNVEEFVKSRNLTDLEITSHTPTETKLYNKKYNISFMCDGIIRYHNKYYILELKTETSRKWSRREGVDSKHLHQASAYSLSLGLNGVIFVYINRDMLNMKSFMLYVTDDMRNEIVHYVETCNKYIKSHRVPPKPLDADNNFCKYCEFRTQCRKDT